MKEKQPLRRFKPDMKGGPIAKHLSNKTPISKSASMVSLTCPVCGISFERKASEAKRHAISYCGRACQGVAQRRQVSVRCRSCGREFTVKASMSKKITCCSKECKKAVLSELTRQRNIDGWAEGLFKFGEDSAFAKLTDAQVSEILADNRSHAEIAKDYGVTRPAISHIKRKVTWARRH